jgi:hypothetical protein
MKTAALMIMVWLAAGAALLAYLFRGQIAAVTADATAENVSLWIYDSDATPGSTIDASVRIDGGERVRIERVFVDVAGQQREVEGAGDTWGEKIVVDKKHDFQDASAALDFAIEVPAGTAAGRTLPLTVRVDSVTASILGDQFTNQRASVTFHRYIAIYSPTASRLRRVGKAAIALGSAALVVLVLSLGVRRYRRRNIEPSNAWVLLLVPYPVIGYFAFVHPLSEALRLHGAWFATVGSVAWFGVLAIPAVLTARAGMHRYTVSQVMLPSAGADHASAYREASMSVPTRPAVDIEGAWIAAGLQVHRSKRHLSVATPGVTPAIVTVPESETFGGAPFVILSRDRNTVIRMLDAIAPLLGELLCTSDHEHGELKFGARGNQAEAG